MITASPARLQNGSWGARVPGTPSVGSLIEVRTSSGKTWGARVVRVIRPAKGPGDSSLVATESLDTAHGRGSSEEVLAERGLIRVGGRRGSYVRRMSKQERFDEFDM